MQVVNRRLPLLLLMLVICAASPAYADAPAAAQKQFGADGFTINYPDTWLATCKFQSDWKSEMHRRLGHAPDASADKMSVIIFSNDGALPGTCLSVLATNESLTLDDSAIASLKTAVNNVGDRAGSPATDVRIGMENFGQNHAVVAHYFILSHNQPIYQMMAGLPGRTSSYIVVCACSAAEAPRFGPIFSSMISSMKYDPPLPPQGVSSMQIGAGAGGIVAVVVVRWFLRRNKEE